MKILWYYILLLTLLLNLPNSNGQCIFHKLYDYNEMNNGGFSVIQTDDGGYICSSIIYDGGLLASYIVKVDECGDTSWARTFNFSTIGTDDGKSIIQLDDGDYAICGQMTDSIEMAKDTYLLKLDSNGDTIWYRTIEGGFNDGGIMHKEINDGFIIGGRNYDSTFTTSQVFLIKTDSFGNKEWQQEYGDTGHDDLKSIDFTLDGGYIIGGDFENPVTGSWDLYLIKTDSQGNEEWKEYYGTPYSDRKGYTIATADSGYAIVGYTTSAIGEVEGYVVKTDSLGGVQWEKTYGIPNYNDYFKFIQQLPDGKFMIAGGKADTTTANGRLVWLLKMDTNGDTLWTKSYTYYGENTHTYVEDLQLTNDGGFIMTGYIAGNPRPNKNDLWLLKTDSLGNTCEIDTVTWEGCSELVSVVEIKDNNETGNILIYPNPAEEYITIESYDQAIRKVEISDIHGRIVRSVCNINTGSENINLSELRAGLYFVRVQCDQFVKTLKIVKQ